MLSLLLAGLLGAAPLALGPVRLAPPPGFSLDADLGQGQSAALAVVAGEGDPERRLLGVFRTSGDDPATLSLSTVDAPLALEPGSRAALAAAVAGHFKRALDLSFTLDHTAAFPGRVEVWGTVPVEGRTRTVAAAFYPGEHHYAVAVASLAAGDAVALRPELEAAFASLTLAQPPEPVASRRTLISVAVWGAAALALLASRLWKRRRPTVQENV